MNTIRNNRHGSAKITLPAGDEMLITRQFDAPAELVFKAISTPEFVKRWWGFDTSVWKECELDFRVGGKWRYLTVDDGFEVGFSGEYLEIDAPHRIVSTEVYDPFPDAGSVNTVTLEEADGVTTMTTFVKCASQEARDAMIDSGMESGMQVSYNRLEDLVHTL